MENSQKRPDVHQIRSGDDGFTKVRGRLIASQKPEIRRGGTFGRLGLLEVVESKKQRDLCDGAWELGCAGFSRGVSEIAAREPATESNNGSFRGSRMRMDSTMRAPMLVGAPSRWPRRPQSARGRMNTPPRQGPRYVSSMASSLEREASLSFAHFFTLRACLGGCRGRRRQPPLMYIAGDMRRRKRPRLSRTSLETRTGRFWPFDAFPTRVRMLGCWQLCRPRP